MARKKTSCEICGKKMRWDGRRQKFVARTLSACSACGRTHCAECGANGTCVECYFGDPKGAESKAKGKRRSKTTTIEDRVPQPSGRVIDRPKRSEPIEPKESIEAKPKGAHPLVGAIATSIDDLNRAMWRAEKQDDARAAVASMAPALTSIIDLLIEGIAERRVP